MSYYKTNQRQGKTLDNRSYRKEKQYIFNKKGFLVTSLTTEDLNITIAKEIVNHINKSL